MYCNWIAACVRDPLEQVLGKQYKSTFGIRLCSFILDYRKHNLKNYANYLNTYLSMTKNSLYFVRVVLVNNIV